MWGTWWWRNSRSGRAIVRGFLSVGQRSVVVDVFTDVVAADRTKRYFPAPVGAEPGESRLFVGTDGDLHQTALGSLRYFLPVSSGIYGHDVTISPARPPGQFGG